MIVEMGPLFPLPQEANGSFKLLAARTSSSRRRITAHTILLSCRCNLWFDAWVPLELLSDRPRRKTSDDRRIASFLPSDIAMCVSDFEVYLKFDVTVSFPDKNVTFTHVRIILFINILILKKKACEKVKKIDALKYLAEI